MSARPIDVEWKRWLGENLERGCAAEELFVILLKQRFAAGSIIAAMGPRFPGPERLSTGRPRLSGSWRNWLHDNLERQCDAEELVGILLENGFSLSSIAQEMGQAFPLAAIVGITRQPDEEGRVVHEQLLRPRLARVPAGNVHKVDTDRLQLYAVDDFMTPQECQELCALIDLHLRPSTVTLAETDRYFRTSRTCDLSLLNDPLVDHIDDRIARTLGIRLAYSEGIQAQRYDVGQEFKPHTDYFEPGTDEYQEHAATRGNRTWTFMVYLNDDVRGGGTKFAAIDKVFHPKTGRAIAWNNLRRDGSPNYDTLHSGMPVEAGYKIVITKWFREKGSGPMLYED